MIDFGSKNIFVQWIDLIFVDEESLHSISTIDDLDSYLACELITSSRFIHITNKSIKEPNSFKVGGYWSPRVLCSNFWLFRSHSWIVSFRFVMAMATNRFNISMQYIILSIVRIHIGQWSIFRCHYISLSSKCTVHYVGKPQQAAPNTNASQHILLCECVLQHLAALLLHILTAMMRCSKNKYAFRWNRMPTSIIAWRWTNAFNRIHRNGLSMCALAIEWREIETTKSRIVDAMRDLALIRTTVTADFF